MGDWVLPLLAGGIVFYGLLRNVSLFEAFAEGVQEGLKTVVSLLPALLAMVLAVGMFRASGAAEVLAHALIPLAEWIKIPKEAVPLAIFRPVSATGALAYFRELLNTAGPDSFAGRTASTIMGATETTLYVVMVYAGSVGLNKTRYALPVGLLADLVGFWASAAAIRLLFGVE